MNPLPPSMSLPPGDCSWGVSRHVTKFYDNVAWHTTKFAGISIYPYLLMVCYFVMIITSEPQRMDDSRVQPSQNDTWNKHKAMPHQTKGIHKLFWPHINARVVNHFFPVLPKLKNHGQDPWASDDHLLTDCVKFESLDHFVNCCTISFLIVTLTDTPRN